MNINIHSGHLSSPTFAYGVKRFNLDLAEPLARLNEQNPILAAGRVYHFATSPWQTVGSYPTLFTLARR